MSYIWFGVLAGVLAFTLPLTRNKSWFGSRKLLRRTIIGGEVAVVIAAILFCGGTDLLGHLIGSARAVYAQNADLNFTCGAPHSDTPYSCCGTIGSGVKKENVPGVRD